LDRRSFLKAAAAAIAAAGTTSYFDIGGSWQKHNEIWLLDQFNTGDLIEVGGGPFPFPVRRFQIKRVHSGGTMELDPVGLEEAVARLSKQIDRDGMRAMVKAIGPPTLSESEFVAVETRNQRYDRVLRGSYD
jgi:hypothetical protein